MSILRQDAATKEWVIIAAERARRPHDFARPPQTTPRGSATATAKCPFCPGNEDKTPPAIYTVPAPSPDAGAPWQVRVFPNKFPALKLEGTTARRLEGRLFRQMDGAGAHEVVVETPRHDGFLASLDDREVEAIVRAYRERYNALRLDPRVEFILIFKNHGQSAGTSLEHPHSQIVATPVAPAEVRRRYEVATVYFDDMGHCVYCDMVEEERIQGKRVVWEDDAFLVFHPYASRFPFETWIAPKRHHASFGSIPDEDLPRLAKVLRRTLRQLHLGLNDPDFNYMVHTAPVEDEHKAYYLWHIQIVPHLTTPAGFEMGSRMFINTMLPEDTAAYIRGIEG